MDTCRRYVCTICSSWLPQPSIHYTEFGLQLSGPRGNTLHIVGISLHDHLGTVNPHVTVERRTQTKHPQYWLGLHVGARDSSSPGVLFGSLLMGTQFVNRMRQAMAKTGVSQVIHRQGKT
jgi:hypothetical protein